MAENSILSISGKVTLVTGGGRGLGRAFSVGAAEFGSDIVCVDIDKQGIEETKEIIHKLGRRVLPIKADITKADEVNGIMDKTLNEFGRIDVLVNNAGISSKPAKIHKMSIEDWDKVLNTNLGGVFLCMRAALPIMMKQKKGCIINVSSVTGLKAVYRKLPSINFANYSASKAGIIALTRQAAVEYAKYGIRINCIAPGWHHGTSLSANWTRNWTAKKIQKLHRSIIEKIPMGRYGDPHELKGLLVYLASDASSFVTGQVFIQDGGWSA